MVTGLSLAYHEAVERVRSGGSTVGQAEVRQVHRLLRATVAARRAFADTEEALARLAAGHYGQCEQCSGPIPVEWLAREPETRYCGRCFPWRHTRLT